MKEKTRASSSLFPFENIPMMVLIHTVYTAVFWLNAFPNMSEKQWFSPREIITGLTIDYKRDCKAVAGAYVEASTDAEITNDNSERRKSCIYLGPAGNRQGSSKCFVIETGAVVVRRIFDILPYPDAILKKVENWGKRSKRAILRGRIDFLNRKGEKFDWDNDDLADLKAVDEQPKLVHPDIISEIPGIETADMYDDIIGPTPDDGKKRLYHMLSARLKRTLMQA